MCSKSIEHGQATEKLQLEKEILQSSQHFANALDPLFFLGSEDLAHAWECEWENRFPVPLSAAPLKGGTAMLKELKRNPQAALLSRC
jgi:hypothetical protein